MAWIEEDDFRKVTSLLPLISIDLIVRNTSGLILLGKRKNPPAKDYWFVPGGRIRRMESFSSAFSRITKTELGVATEISEARLRGLFQHIYDHSAFSTEVGTHYVSIGMDVEIEGLEIDTLPDIQHAEYGWFEIQEIMEKEHIHPRTKDFFDDEIGIRFS